MSPLGAFLFGRTISSSFKHKKGWPGGQPSDVAFRGFFIRKNDILVVQVQEGVDQEVNHPMSPLGFFIRKNNVLVVQAQEGVDQEVNHPMSPLGTFKHRV